MRIKRRFRWWLTSPGILLLLLAPVTAQPDNPISSQFASVVSLVSPIKQPDFDKDVLAPLHSKQAQIKSSCDAQGGTLSGDTCVVPPPPPTPPVVYYGNTYDFGQCTAFVASKRNIPSNWGNANQWYYNAQAAGFATGSVPRPGAIGVSFLGYYGHVVYIESVNADGSVNLSEMNYQGLDVVDYRTAPASEFVYIY